MLLIWASTVMDFGWSQIPDFSYLQNSIETINQYLSGLQTVVAWSSHHPYWAVAIALLSLTLLQVLLSLTSTALKRAVIWLLQAPLRLIGWGLIQGFRSTQQALSPTTVPSTDEQIDQVLAQLEVLRSEQEVLLQELRQLLDRPADSLSTAGVTSQLPPPKV
ncbi:MAG: hypothetical protein F6J97_24040 [Leptolyngbya sp. SIO4C1]|nr:hypothetical protein [Leptolyngbya sp. SIO4C1]